MVDSSAPAAATTAMTIFEESEKQAGEEVAGKATRGEITEEAIGDEKATEDVRDDASLPHAAPLRPARGPENGEPEVTGPYCTWERVTKVFGREIATVGPINEMTEQFVLLARDLIRRGERAAVWKEWAEKHIAELMAMMDRMEEANKDIDEQDGIRQAKLDKALAKIEAKQKALDDTELEVYWKKIEAGFKAKHEAFKAVWSHNAKFPTQLAYIVEGQLSLNFDHPYLQGYLFGVWLKTSKVLMNHDSIWFQMDTKPFHEEEWGLCSPVEDTGFTWFSGIRDGSKGVDVREFLARREEGEVFQDIEAKAEYAVFDPQPPVWTYRVEGMPKWLSKGLE